MKTNTLNQRKTKYLFTHKAFAKLETEVSITTIFSSAFKQRNILILRPTICSNIHEEVIYFEL